MKLSVVILNYNVKAFLQLCLQSVEKAIINLDAEIIVIDNASTDGSMQMVARLFPNIRRIENTANVGFSKANNQAVKEAKGEFVCILNPDTVIPENIFQKLLSYAQQVPDFGAIGVKLVDGTGAFLPESKRQLPTPRVAFQKLTGNSNNYYEVAIAPNEVGKVAVLVGAFMFMLRDRYNQVGGFDEDYFMYGEDIDLSYKLTQAGYSNYYNGDIAVIHYKGESTSKDTVYQQRFYDAMSLFYKKHFSNGTLQNFLVSKSLSIAKAVKILEPKTIQKQHAVSTYIYLGNDERVEYVIYKLKDKTTETVTVAELPLLKLKNVQLIFDAEISSFQDIINLIITNRGRGNTFRIKPESCDFILGSDNSTSKGEVLPLTLEANS